MIVVGPMRPGARGAVCRMTSDDSVRELLDFAAALGLRLSWYHPEDVRQHPHFEISIGMRVRAVRRGARPVSAAGLERASSHLIARETAAQLAREASP